MIMDYIIFLYWEKKFLTEARKKELETKRAEKSGGNFIPKLWTFLHKPIEFLIPLLFIIDGLTLSVGIIYSPYITFCNPIDTYLQILGVIIIFFGLIFYLITGKIVIKHVYSKATEERKMITTGIYSYIRHPHYLAHILIPVGLIFLTLNYLSLFYFMAFTLFTNSDLKECGREGKFTFIAKAARCEEENLKKIYVEHYEEYMKKTGRLLPKFRKN